MTIIQKGIIGSSSSDTSALEDKVNSRFSVLIEIPVLSNTIQNGTVTTLRLGTPSLKVGEGVASDYVTISNNIVKLIKTDTILVLSGFLIAEASTQTSAIKEFDFFISRPSTPNNVVHSTTKIKTKGNLALSTEYAFKTSYVADQNDPFIVDGFILRLDNSIGSSILVSESKEGFDTISSLRIKVERI